MKSLESTRRYRKTKKGILTNSYNHQKRRLKVDYTLKELHLKFLEDRKFNRLFNEWIKSKYDKQFRPSIDRINSKKHYTLKNIHMLTWAENRFKQTMERRSRKGKVCQIFGNEVIKIFKSQREAVKKTGLNQSGISNCLTNKRKYCGGYKWEYLNENLIETK